MKDKAIFITDNDLLRLRRLIETKGKLEGRDKQYLTDLKNELDKAVVLPTGEVPPYVVTMDSRFRLKDLDTGAVAEYTLVYPGKADISQGRLSVLAPIGTALLGYQELDTVEWHVPAGLKRFRIEQILYQPEAAEACAP
jgi:regulator of nucleoside diphosphate kinase